MQCGLNWENSNSHYIIPQFWKSDSVPWKLQWWIQTFGKEITPVLYVWSSVQFSSVQSLSRVWLFATPCSMPGLPVHHQLPEFTQAHVRWVGDAIQPSHPLSSPSPPAPNPYQHQSFPMSQLFTWGGQSTGVSALASVLPKNTQDWSPLSRLLLVVNYK